MDNEDRKSSEQTTEKLEPVGCFTPLDQIPGATKEAREARKREAERLREQWSDSPLHTAKAWRDAELGIDYWQKLANSYIPPGELG